jgi:hypothetical protein
VSPEPGRTLEDDRVAGLLDMYRVAIEDLQSMDDPAVAPLMRELQALRSQVGTPREGAEP